jgi:hypothetical protein
MLPPPLDPNCNHAPIHGPTDDDAHCSRWRVQSSGVALYRGRASAKNVAGGGSTTTIKIYLISILLVKDL